MEKFGRFSDPSTGIKPFVPIFKSKEERSNKKNKSIFIGRFLMGSLKLFPFLLLMSLSYINNIISNLFFIKKIQRIYLILTNKIIFAPILWLFGEYNKDIAYVSLNKNEERSSWNHCGCGDILFTNLSSYINLIWLHYKISPNFVVPLEDNKCVVLPIHTLLYRILLKKDLREGNKQDIKSVLKANDAPNVILCEQSVSNGEGLLKFQKFSSPILSGANIHIVGFKRVFSLGPSPNFTAGNGIVNLIYQLGVIKTKCEIKMCMRKNLPFKDNNIISENDIDEVRNILSKVLRLSCVNLGSDNYHEFLKYYSVNMGS